MTESFLAGASTAPTSIRATAAVTSAIVSAARQLLIDLERGRRVDIVVLRNAMDAAFDATGVASNLMSTYEATEAAATLFLRCCSDAMRCWLSYLAPTLRCASIILTKGFRGFGTSSNDGARARGSEIDVGGLGLASGRPRCRTGKT
jgi:hypothetical protein